MNDDQKIEACAQAAHEANRAYCIAMGDTSQVAWKDEHDYLNQITIEKVRSILNGELYATLGDFQKDMLFFGVVRCVAAALQMSVTYPAIEAHGDKPALPKRTIDWSKQRPGL